MTLPTAYTEATLKTYMLDELGSVADTLAITVDSLNETANNCLVVYGVTDIANATDITKIRAIARVEAWLKASSEVSVDYDFSDGGASYSRSQAQQLILNRLMIAERDAAPYYATYQATTAKMSFTEDPYKRPNILDMRDLWG